MFIFFQFLNFHLTIDFSLLILEQKFKYKRCSEFKTAFNLLETFLWEHYEKIEKNSKIRHTFLF